MTQVKEIVKLVDISRPFINRVRDALLMGIDVSGAARATSTYHHKKAEQMKAYGEALSDLYALDKSIPLLISTLPSTTRYFKELALFTELQKGANKGVCQIVNQTTWYEGKMEGNILAYIISQLPITNVLRVFKQLVEAKVNNRRTSFFMIRYCLGLNPFQIVKYRTKIRMILKHAIGSRKFSKLIASCKKIIANYSSSVLSCFDEVAFVNSIYTSVNLDSFNYYEESVRFLFIDRVLEDEHLSKYDGDDAITKYMKLKKVTDQEEFFTLASCLDTSVVMGLLSTSLRDQFPSFFEIKNEGIVLKDEVKARILSESQVTTDEQILRSTKRAKKLGVDLKEVDSTKVTAEAVYKTDIANRGLNVEKLKSEKADQDQITLPFDNIGIIVDNSVSMSGKADSKNTSAALGGHFVTTLLKSVSETSIVGTGSHSTNYSAAYLTIMKQHNPEAIIIVGDGYENSPYDGALDDVIQMLKDNLIPAPLVYLLSPISGAEEGGTTRNLGKNIVCISANNMAHFELQMKARKLEIDTVGWLTDEFSKFLEPFY